MNLQSVGSQRRKIYMTNNNSFLDGIFKEFNKEFKEFNKEFESIFQNGLNDQYKIGRSIFENVTVSPNYHTKIVDGEKTVTIYVPELDQSTLTVEHTNNKVVVSFRNGSTKSSLSFDTRNIDVSTLKADFSDPVIILTAKISEDSADGLIKVNGLDLKKKDKKDK